MLENISVRRYIATVVIALTVLIGGTSIVIKATTDHLLYTNAMKIAERWAQYLAANVSDLEQIAAGEAPSSASMAFLGSAKTAGDVFRYTIFNRFGYSMLVADRDRVTPVDLSEFNAAAAESVKRSRPVVDTKEGRTPNEPAFYSEAYVPVMLGGRPVAVVAAFVDETAARSEYFWPFLFASVALCSLSALAFGLPSLAWYRRTREMQQADRRIQYLAHHDALTGMMNRARLVERLEGLLAALPATGRRVAVHFIDTDRFKEINDTYGHDGGDFLLKTVGERLRAMTRIEDAVARIGGDEFVVVQTDVRDKAQAEELAARIRSVLAVPVTYREQELRSSYTVGVAVAPEDGTTVERLLKSADLALYAGKHEGRDCVRFFAPEMDDSLRKRVALEKMLRAAVARNAFVLHYQPIFEAQGRRLVGFEALIRLPAPDGTLIGPNEFIPLAEELHLIEKIGAWVLREACRTAAAWPPALTVAVNLSPAQFESGDIERTVADALKQSGLAPQRLELEITETLLLSKNEAATAMLRRLKEMGPSVVMDDFGTGYSSLSYLWKFPFDKIKIDRSFMQSFDKSGHDVETVVKTILALGREMNMRVTVEGVETVNQVDFLYDAHADQVQGFYFGQPVPAAKVSADILGQQSETMSHA